MDGFIDRIYEAAVIPELWRGALSEFAQIADAREAVLLVGRGERFRWIGSSTFIEELTKRHYHYPGAVERTRRLLALNRPGFVGDRDVFSEREILAEPLFTECLIPAGLGRGIATAIRSPTGDLAILHAESAYRYGPTDPQRLAWLDALRPHIARASLLASRLSLEAARTAVDVLDRLGLAACAVREGGAVAVANREFERMEGYWTTRGRDGIALLDHRADTQLRDAVAAIAAHGGVRSIPIRAGDAATAAVLHVLPVRRLAFDIFAGAAAILVLTRPTAPAPQATPLLAALFDLTPAEARVATAIADGKTIARIAEEDRKSAETVRNQLKSVLGKTGCSRQSDLVRLLTHLL